MTISIKPDSAFGNLTPEVPDAEVTLLISDANCVASLCVEPDADILSVVECLINVPTEVMFGCAAVVTVPAIVALDTVPVILAPVIDVNPDPLPVNIPVFAVTAEVVIVPLTPNVVSVPTDVMFG